MSSHDPITGAVLCDKGCPYPRDGGECLRRKGVPGAGGSFGAYCECECHLATPNPRAPEYYGELGKAIDKMSDEQVSYEHYAAELAEQALGKLRDQINEQRLVEVLRIQACDAVLRRRKR